MSTNERISLSRHGDVAVLRIDNPPVNAISAEVVRGLGEALEAFERDDGARALVISCAGRTFVAGGDISVFDQPGFSAAPFNRVLARIEASARPVVAALHGTVLDIGTAAKQIMVEVVTMCVGGGMGAAALFEVA